MAHQSVVRFGRIGSEHVVRIDGRGTQDESPGFYAFVERILENEPSTRMVLDLHNCEYLDSTFLGCLLKLHKHFGQQRSARFVIAASRETCTRLFTSTRLDRILNLTDAEPEAPVEWKTIPAGELGKEELGRHVMQSHQRLAELGGPRAAAFGLVAEQLARDLKDNAS